jgi:hypothetical protein
MHYEIVFRHVLRFSAATECKNDSDLNQLQLLSMLCKTSKGMNQLVLRDFAVTVHDSAVYRGSNACASIARYGFPRFVRQLCVRGVAEMRRDATVIDCSRADLGSAAICATTGFVRYCG